MCQSPRTRMRSVTARDDDADASSLSNLATTYVARTINTMVPAAALCFVFGGSPPPLASLIFAQVLLALELYQPIRRLVHTDRQSVVLAFMQLLYLTISLRHFHGRHISDSLLGSAWFQKSRAARLLQFLLVNSQATTTVVSGAGAGLLCISSFEALFAKDRLGMVQLIVASAAATWLVSAPSTILVRVMRSSSAWMLLVCWLVVLRDVGGFMHEYSAELLSRREPAADSAAQRWSQEREELYARAVRSDRAQEELQQVISDQQRRLECLQGDSEALSNCSAEEIQHFVLGTERALPILRESFVHARVQQAQAQARREAEEERTTCAICMQRPRDCLLSCGHIVCTACARQRDCAFCRKHVTSRTRAYV